MSQIVKIIDEREIPPPSPPEKKQKQNKAKQNKKKQRWFCAFKLGFLQLTSKTSLILYQI